MIAQEAFEYLQAGLKDGSINPNEPVFLLEPNNPASHQTVFSWCQMARGLGTPTETLEKAIKVGIQMKSWIARHPPQAQKLPVQQKE